MKHIIPAMNWQAELACAIHSAQPGDIIVVNTKAKEQLAQIAMERMNRTDLTIEVEYVPSAPIQISNGDW